MAGVSNTPFRLICKEAGSSLTTSEEISAKALVHGNQRTKDLAGYLAEEKPIAMQLFGGMGMSKELPLEFISRVVRIYRVVEGPSEVHRWVVARDLLKNGLSL